MSLDGKSALRKTIQSVGAQTYRNIEYVVVDGGSSDGTSALRAEASDIVSTFVSEPDNGIYDAMNKGVRLASGAWVIFLNAGDVFASPDTLSEVAPFLTEARDLVYGSTIFVDETDREEIVHAAAPETLWQALNFNHNSLFCRRSLLLETPFDTAYKIVADSEFAIRCFKAGKTFLDTGLVINRYRRGGYGDQHSMMRTIERWKLVWDSELVDEPTLHAFYMDRLLREPALQDRIRRHTLSGKLQQTWSKLRNRLNK